MAASKTGDIGILDEKGFIKIADRKKRHDLVWCGFNVYPNAKLKKAMTQHPAVLEAGAIGVPSDDRGEDPGKNLRSVKKKRCNRYPKRAA